VCEVATQGGQYPLVDSHQHVDGVLSDLKRRQVRQEIVTHEEAHENEVVDDALQVKLERQLLSLHT
jgi:anti-sigma factor RsiW